jgi:hypothetical protein
MRLHIDNKQEKGGQMTIKRNIVLLISLLSLGVGMALAQIESSTITGTVTDQKGAVVASANITITEVNTGVNTTVKSNGVGEYTAPYLTQGLYTVTVQAPAFETYKKTGIPLASKTVVRIDVQLTVGSVSQTVEVTASTAELQTETTTVQGTVDANVIMNIPNINDNPLYYATLQAGVVPSSEMYNNEALGVGYSDRQKMSGMNINGGEAGNNDVQIDGLSVQGAAWHESSQLPNRDALQEVAVTTNALSADLGGGLGVIQMSTKSGTNQFHGDLAYRMRNEAFNANGTSNDVQGIPKGKYRLNEESGAVGGPIRIPYIFDGRDKVFFFTSYSRDSHPSTESGFDTVPTALQRTGDLSASSMRDRNGNPIHSQMYNPYTAVSCTTVLSGPCAGSNQVWERTEYPQGPSTNPYDHISGDMVTSPDAAGLVILSQFPLPNHAPSNAFQDNNFYYSGGQSTVRDNFSARMDFHLTSKQSIYVSGGLQDGAATVPNEWANGSPAQSGYAPKIDGVGWGLGYSDENYFGSIGDTIAISPTMIVNVRYGINRIHAMAAKPDADTSFTASDYATWGMPASVQAYIAIPGVAPTIGWTGGDLPFDENWDIWDRKNEHQTNHTLAASVTKLLGKWTLKEGAEYRVYLGNWADLGSATPMYATFTGSSGDPNTEEYGSNNGGGSSVDTTPQITGDGTAATIVGAQGWTLGSGETSKPALAAKYLAFYTQNDWKATPRLTVNLGLRYEVQPGPTERHNQVGDLDLNAANPYSAQGINAANASADAGLGRFVFAGDPGYSRNMWATTWNNIAPRVGAAYQLGNSSVLRVGYGRIYTPSNTGFNANTTIYGTAGFAGGTVSTPYGIGSLAQPFNGLPVGTGFEDPRNTQILPALGRVQAPGVYGGFGDPGLFTRNHRNGYMDEWNLTFERRFRGWIASAGYVGSRGTHIPWRDEQLNGQFDIPWTTLQGWQSTWQATAGAINPGSITVSNPLPGLIGGAAGASGSGSISTMQSMEPYLAWLGGDMVGDNATSLYHSLQLKAQHSYNSGLSALFTYIYSRATGLTGGQTASNGNGSTYAESQLGGATPLGGTDYRNFNNNNSLLNFDTPNRFVGVVSYLLPTGKGQRFDPGNPVARAVIGEWNIATVVTLQEGAPWGPNCGSENGRCIPSGQALKLPKSFQKWYDGNTQVTLPDGRTYTPSSHTKLYWNPDAFTGQIVQWADESYHQAQYWLGTTKQAMPELRMPVFQNVNLSVSRKFPIREGMSFEILAEATNAFNHSNYSPSDVSNGYGSLVTIADPTHGSTVGENSSTSTGSMGTSYMDARQMTLSARFDF